MKPKENQNKLPKNALSKINLGHSFAEYDKNLMAPGIFVETPAIKAALGDSNSKCFFVGRRGTGKTAITFFIGSKDKNSLQLLPQIFSPLRLRFDVASVRDTRQRPFRSLVHAFRRALQDEVISQWVDRKLIKYSDFGPYMSKERNFIDDMDFDFRMLKFVEDLFGAINDDNEREWLRQVRRIKDVGKEMEELREGPPWNVTIMIDRVDESWDGSDVAVIMLTALMHACVEMYSSTPDRPLIFLRENIFERVRAIDNEFSRLETWVVSLDWSPEMLLEMVERRLNMPFNTKLPLKGPTWDYFFENIDGGSSRSYVFDYCQQRPRDVLTYCSFAIEAAQLRQHERVTIEDLQQARRRFSDSRLKDLGDEYSENYPQIQLVLQRFFGLGKTFTVPGVENFISKLIVDEEIKRYCGVWIYDYTTADRFIHLLYNIGFLGVKSAETVEYRSLGPRSSTPPPISITTIVEVHPSYREALNLQDAVVDKLDASISLQSAGLQIDLPQSFSLDEYYDRLSNLQDDLKTLPTGISHSSRFEEIVADVVKLCFFRSLTNVDLRVRDVDGRVVRDVIASNRASSGFWEMVRGRYNATQIIWECKNFTELNSDVFQQVAYYLGQAGGKFGVLAFRGHEIKKHYYQHIRRVSNDRDGMILLLTEKDLNVFMRQALNGKVKEDHIQDVYDRTIREVS